VAHEKALEELRALQAEAANLSDAVAAAAQDGDGEAIIHGNRRGPELQTLIKAAKLRERRAWLAVLEEKVANAKTAAQVDYSAEIEAAQAEFDRAKKRLNDAHQRQQQSREARRSAEFGIADVKREIAELIAAQTKPNASVRSVQVIGSIL
jgi:hypothetical protein